MKKLIVLSFSLLALTSCNKEPENLMSPCVGAKGSPCERTPINNHSDSVRV
jgi:hypothetical protein